MSKADDFFKSEKEHYGKIYSDISYAMNETLDFLDEDTKSKRKYINKINILKKYLDLIHNSETELKSMGFKAMFSGDKYIDLLEKFKKENKDCFQMLKGCSMCKCINCVTSSTLDGCTICKHGGHVNYCDHEKVCAYTFDNYILELDNDQTGMPDKYNVLSLIHNAENNKRYAICETVRKKEKCILYYYPNFNKDRYEKITNEDEINYILSIYDNIPL